MPGTSREDSVFERRHCMDHTGQVERTDGNESCLATLERKIDEHFVTTKWLIGGLTAALVGFGGFLLGQSTQLGTAIAVNSEKILNLKASTTDNTKDINDIQVTLWHFPRAEIQSNSRGVPDKSK